MTIVYVMLAIIIVLSLAAVAVGVLAVKRANKASPSTSSDDVLRTGNDIKQTVQMENRMLTGAINAQVDNTRSLMERFDRFMLSTDQKYDRMRVENAQNMAEMRTNNAAEMEKMRAVVDEKLTTTLDQRFNQSFKIVNDRLEEINKEFADLQNLQSSVKDLNGIFRNVKTRGTWGEISLENLLAQILTPEQYIKQAQIKRGEGEEGRVDFAIKLPGQGDGTVLLPIDAKFPLEDYQRLVEASTSGNVLATDAAVKALADAVLKQARSIRDKYITPKTTDFAIMYLPVEGLYAEVAKQTGLLEKLQNECKVNVCGPTTLAALLNSLRMGFRSVAIEKSSKEIAETLRMFQKDFAVFNKYLGLLKARVQTVQTTIEAAEKKSNTIGSRLSKVTKLDMGDDGVDLLESFGKDTEDISFDEKDNKEENV